MQVASEVEKKGVPPSWFEQLTFAFEVGNHLNVVFLQVQRSATELRRLKRVSHRRVQQKQSGQLNTFPVCGAQEKQVG